MDNFLVYICYVTRNLLCQVLHFLRTSIQSNDTDELNIQAYNDWSIMLELMLHELSLMKSLWSRKLNLSLALYIYVINVYSIH